MEFSFAKVEVLYDEKNHDGYCSGAEDDEDLSVSHTVEMIMSVPVPDSDESDDSDDVDINKFVAKNHDLFGKHSTGWKNCTGSGYCDIESNRTVTKVTIHKKNQISYEDSDFTSIPTTTTELDANKKKYLQQIYDTAFNIHFALERYATICSIGSVNETLETRITRIRLLREKFSSIRSPEDVRINEIINNIELNILYRDRYARSYLKLTDYDLLIKKIEPVVQAIIAQTKYNHNIAIKNYESKINESKINESKIHESKINENHETTNYETKKYDIYDRFNQCNVYQCNAYQCNAYQINANQINANQINANQINANNYNTNNCDEKNYLNRISSPMNSVDTDITIENHDDANITDTTTTNINHKKRYQFVKLCVFPLMVGAFFTGMIYWHLDMN
jgi:hypothetical protein